MRLATTTLLSYGLWAAVLIVVLVLEVIPVALVVVMFSLAVGVPEGPGLFAIPAIFVAMVLVACVIATRQTRRFNERPRPPASHGTGEFRRRSWPPKFMTPSEYYRAWRRLG